MTARVESQMTEAEERKRRQERFRKRSASLFNKASLLAKDTDAWIALIVRDRAGRIKSFRASNDLHWPPSIKDLNKKQHSGSHKFIKKHFVSGGWRVVAEDESYSAVVDDDADSLMEDFLAVTATPAETDAGSDSSITVSPCYPGKGVEVVADPPNEALDKTVEPRRRTEVNAHGELDGTITNMPEESDSITVDVLGESNHASVDSLKTPSAVSDSDREPGRVGPKGSDNMMTDTVGGSTNTTLDVPVEPKTAEAQLLGDADRSRDVPGMATATVYDTIEVDHAASVSFYLNKDQKTERQARVPSFPQPVRRCQTPPPRDSQPAPSTYLTIRSILNPPAL